MLAVFRPAVFMATLCETPARSKFRIAVRQKSWKSFPMSNSQTIRTIAWAADVRQDRTLPENGTAANRGRQKLRFQTLHIAELGTFRRLTLPEIPSSLLLMYPTYSLLDIRWSDSVLCRLAIVEF
jgi:hypothetical protein